jgi:hypothetical protein
MFYLFGHSPKLFTASPNGALVTVVCLVALLVVRKLQQQ